MRPSWRKNDFDRQGALGFGVTRRAAMAGGAMALATALAACADDSVPDAFSPPGVAADSGLRGLIEGGPDLVVAGERLHAGLLRRFYAHHGYEPVWTTRQAQAHALMEAVLRAPEQGLDPALFHATVLRQGNTLSPDERDVLLSDAFLAYADALSRGAVPVERRKGDEVLSPEPVDVVAALDNAIDSPEPGAAIEALAPTTPTYRALREALQKYRSGGSAAATIPLRAIEVNLERQRWLPRVLPADRVWVNVADQRLVMYRADQPVFTTRIVVGEDIERNQSPEFRATIDASFYNPPWVIPADIATAEILPKASRDPGYLTRNRMVMLANGDVEQLPGPEAGLGLIMFDMPNSFDVYLHDTPDRYIFNRDNRRISHGCIRVQNPRKLAALLMKQPIGTIDDGIAAGSTTRVDLPTPVPVFVVYQTAFVDTAGVLQFHPDFYNRDAAIWRALQKHPQGRPNPVQAGLQAQPDQG